jgi:hypothetical protein
MVESGGKWWKEGVGGGGKVEVWMTFFPLIKMASEMPSTAP